MKKLTLTLILGLIATLNFLNASEAEVAAVHSMMKRAADWQLANPIENRSLRDWTMAPFYDGLIATARSTDDPKYLEEVIRFGDSVGWQLGLRKYHADDHAVGNAWLEIYTVDTSRNERLAQVRKSLARIVEETRAGKTDRGTSGAHGAWFWCDALYMGPRVYAKLFRITGDQTFADYMDSEFKKSHDGLYDAESKLFYRDSKYLNKKTASGKKVFWSRGEGWVIAGLCSILNDLPKDYKNRAFYENLYKEMAAAILEIQQADGSWPMNLGDAEDIKGGESSGTAFFAFAFAWGANNGFLGEEYAEAAMKAWSWLASNQRESGQLVNVQPIGEDPKNYNRGHSETYGTGAFLMAGEQIAKMLGAKRELSDKELYEAAAKLYYNRAPEAFVKIEPRRADDIAWENNFCAFRMYGPSLEKSVENGGIDIWGKTVDYPIISRWYDQELRHGKSYHDDHGEGKDSYNVGDRTGCGGDLILLDGKKVRSNIYRFADVFWTKRDSLHFAVNHRYEMPGGGAVTEFKEFRMSLNSFYFTVNSSFRKGVYNETVLPPKLTEQNTADISPAFGIRLQDADAKVMWDDNVVAVADKLAGYDLVQFAWADKKYSSIPVKFDDQEALLQVKLIDGGFSYASGYSFGARKDFQEKELFFIKKMAELQGR